MLGDGAWIDANPTRWAIANWDWEDGVDTKYTDEPWVAVNNHNYHHFATHEAATDFVRSEIAKRYSTRQHAHRDH